MGKAFAFVTFALVYLGTCYFSYAADVRYRKHVEDMTVQEWSALEAAIVSLHKLDKFDGGGKSVFPQGVDSYERFVQIHGDFREKGACLHGSEEVWFWHRAFLLHFENRLRATNPPASSNITLPYWDWTDKSSGAGGFPAAYEKVGSPLSHDRLDHKQTASSLAPLSVALDMQTDGATDFVDALLKTDDWGSFGGTIQGPTGVEGELESRTHDLIHGSYIGLDNHSPKLAVRDPIFWAHHANLDRLVDKWQSLYPKSGHCLECDSLAYDRDDQAGPLTVRDMLSNSSLKGVTVIYQPRLSASVQKLGPMVTFVASETDSGFGQMSIYRLTIPDRSGKSTLVIPSLNIKSDTFYRGDVYLFPEDVEFKTDRIFKERYRVGVFGSFSAAHGNDGAYVGNRGGNDIRISVDLSTAMRNLPPSEIAKPYRLIIQFVPKQDNASISAINSADVSHGAPELTVSGPTGTQALSLENIGRLK